MTEVRDLLELLDRVWGEAPMLMGAAHLVVDGQQVLSLHEVPGIDLEARRTGGWIEAQVTVARGVRIAAPVHLCLGLLAPRGEQRVRMGVILEEGSAAELLAHCVFPEARQAAHRMEAELELRAGAELHYREAHFHGPWGGVEVTPRARIRLGPDARLTSDFTLTTGRVGRLTMDYRIEVGERAVAEVMTRVFGHASDAIAIRDALILEGEGARGLLKSRVALEDEARSSVVSVAEGNAPGARGHVDCLEIVRGAAHAEAEPIVRVNHPLAKVTHEAAVGTVDQRQLETLMAHGLDPDEAVDVVITGALR
jgi:Fe-S cluster assembly scaffold protein SufB